MEIETARKTTIKQAMEELKNCEKVETVTGEELFVYWGNTDDILEIRAIYALAKYHRFKSPYDSSSEMIVPMESAGTSEIWFLHSCAEDDALRIFGSRIPVIEVLEKILIGRF